MNAEAWFRVFLVALGFFLGCILCLADTVWQQLVSEHRWNIFLDKARRAGVL